MPLQFRPIEREDLEQLQIWRNSPEIRVRCREYRLLSMTDQERWFESLSGDRSVYMLMVINDGVPIGICGLTGINWAYRNAELSIYVGPRDERGKGWGRTIVRKLLSVAFNELNLHRVWLECYQFNLHGIRLFRKCGFSFEGLLRDHVYKNGAYHPSVMMGILKTEWEEHDE